MDIEILKPVLENVFIKFYDSIIQDKHLSKFFDKKEQVEALIIKQKESLLNSFSETEKEREFRYFRLGEYHFLLGIPLFDYISSITFIKKQILYILLEKKILEENYLFIDNFFENIKQTSARAYFYLKAEDLLRSRYAELSNTLFYRLHVKWSIDFLEFVSKQASKPNLPAGVKSCVEKNICDFTNWLDSKYISMIIREENTKDKLKKLNESHRITASSILFHMRQNQFVQASSLIETYSNESMQIMYILNKEILKYYENKEQAFLDFVFQESQGYKKGSLIILDIRKLRMINKYQGVEIGDMVVEEVEKAIRSFVVALEEDIVYTKSEAGEFIIFIPDSIFQDQLNSIIENIYYLMSGLKIETKDSVIFPKIAVGIVPLDSKLTKTHTEKILRYTLNRAKEFKTDKPYLLEDNEKYKALDLITKGEEDINFVQKALHGQMLEIFFQPIVDLKTDKIFDLEVLARIKHEDGYLTAGTFIDLIHELDVIVELDLGILEKIKEQAEKISKVTQNVFINVSPLSLRSPYYLSKMKKIIKKLREFNISPHFELTEQALLDNMELVKKIHDEENIYFAVDDFGSGYSSLNTVAKLAERDVIKYIKIDGSIIKNIISSEKTYQILDATSYMTQKLKLKNIAEFIENEETYLKVKELNISYGQGFYFYKPMPIDDLIELKNS